MPISSDRFEALGDDPDGPTPGTNAAKLLAFLRSNPDKAFTQSELAAETDVKAGSVGPTLIRLRERGRVDHRGTYWRVSDHDRDVDAATGHAATTLSDRESEEETPQMAEWQAHAVDPRDTAMSDPFDAGDVFWAPDPYNAGDNPRPWLVLAAETLPYADEEYICAGLTLSDLPANVEVAADDWVVGNDPTRPSYCSPWILATVKHDAVAGPQGALTDAFTQDIVERAVGYLTDGR